jgi:hypothetical protein
MHRAVAPMIRNIFDRRVFLVLGPVLILGTQAIAGHEIEGASTESAVQTVPSIRGAISAGYESKYIFRGTNLTPESDGLVWGEGSVSISPWENGTFTLGIWVGSQVGTATFEDFPATGSPLFQRGRSATDFTARDQTIGRLGVFDPDREFLEIRKRDRAFFSDLYAESFNRGGRVQLEDLLDYISDGYAYLRDAPGPLDYPYFRPAVFPIYYPSGDRSGSFYTARDLGFANNARGFLRASGYRGPFPDQITRMERDLALTQNELHEFRIPLTYTHELGPVAITISNTFYYAEQEISAREVLRVRFASDEARELIDFVSRKDFYAGQRVGKFGNAWYPQLLAPMLPIRPGHPDDFLRHHTAVHEVTARETYDRLDLELSANTKWLLDHGHGWAAYLRPRATFSQTLYSDIDTGEIVLPSYSRADEGGYATLELDGHIPFVRNESRSEDSASRVAVHELSHRDRLSLEIGALTSASFGDRPGRGGEPVRGWHHFEAKAELNWWVISSWRIAPSVHYYSLFSDPPPGTDGSSFWYGFQCELIF